jgi:succinate dehydrogenase/fumarate reductase flavoprotein subunit
MQVAIVEGYIRSATQSVRFFLIADHRAFRKFGMGYVKPFPVPVSSNDAPGYFHQADTLEELARKCDINADGLTRTVRIFNDNAKTGKDPDFKRGKTAYSAYLGYAGNQPNPCLAPLVSAPYYAVELHFGELGSFAGLQTTEFGQVVKETGEIIEGLYAAGNDMSHVMAGEYLAGGSGIGPAMVSGYLAASHAAGNGAS